MKRILLLSSTLLFSGWVIAGSTSGQIGVSLTIVAKCSVNNSGSAPQVDCGNEAAFQPKVSRSKQVENQGENELITVEW
ncbi:hypothetical protein ACQ86O_00690 [Serratia sp. L9]|uniref:hypothetical protein n=1 Tax=Serratia sp. L9 TaxID=3423946 RepID=UPI003D66FDA9